MVGTFHINSLNRNSTKKEPFENGNPLSLTCLLSCMCGTWLTLLPPDNASCLSSTTFGCCSPWEQKTWISLKFFDHFLLYGTLQIAAMSLVLVSFSQKRREKNSRWQNVLRTLTKTYARRHMSSFSLSLLLSLLSFQRSTAKWTYHIIAFSFLSALVIFASI